MKVYSQVSRFFLSVALLMLTGGISSLAQNGKLVFKITPQQAFVFADGRAISESSKIYVLKLSAGEHKIELVNYGYAPLTQTVTITAGNGALLQGFRHAVHGNGRGSFGAMTIEGV